jgi:hypothetical protein
MEAPLAFFLREHAAQGIGTIMARSVNELAASKSLAAARAGQASGHCLGHAGAIVRGVTFLTVDAADFAAGATLSVSGRQHMH